MDSPEPSKSPISSSAAASTSSSSPVQESPFSNYISSLSPIKHDKAPLVTQAFVGLNSPPLVFTSPRINTRRRPQSSSVEVSENGEGDKSKTDGPGSLERSVTVLQQGLITDIKEDDTKNSVSVQPSSSSGCVDEYLADPVEADCANSACTISLKLKQSNNVLQSSVNGLPDSKNLNFDDKNDVGREVDSTQLLSGLSEKGLERKLTFDVKPLKIDNEEHAGQRISDECRKFEADMFDLSSQEKECKNLDSQKVVEDHGNGCDGFLHLPPESLQRVQAYEGFAENVEGDLDVPIHNMTHDLEASEHQRGMSRRCLQFGETQPETTANCNSSSNLANDMVTSTSLATTSEIEGLGSSHVDLSATSRKRQLVNLSQLAINMIPQCHVENSSLTVYKPSGVGLHLNSIVNAIPMGQGGTVSMNLAVDSLGIQEIKSASIASCQSMENMQSQSDAFEKVSAAPQDGILEAKVSMIAGSAACESLHTVESIECHTTLSTKKKLSSEDGDSNEVFNHQSPKKKRQKLSNSTDGEGCKRCNCKKTKCLKLYCDCFAAGIYCDGPCSCQGCFNRPEYEDTVLETRQQIESRNPLAFAPKIVQPFTDFPVNSREDGNWKTPSSARHKRGCNCKRSKCLKKYCECYQANVGCSIGCRCEGCKNVYGKKEDYCLTEEMVSRGGGEISESTVAAKKDFLHSELCDPHYLTPPTPSFQCSDHGKNAPISRLPSSRCLPSPESDPTILSYAKSPRTSDSNDMLLETSKEKLDVGSYCEGINYNNADVLADECHHTPLLNHSSIFTGSSSSSKARELTSLSQFRLGPRSGCISSGGSLHWHRSSFMPMSTLDGTKKLQGLNSDGGLDDILEDDTPELLKGTSTPIKSVKASSPNGKRVSPPHNLHQLRSSSSGPLRSGRKFILKAVPSFPPLTPCIDSKGSSNQSRSNFQENSSND
ncbi:CRC domain-containing protein TSO1-like [Durio zibethinus]|uniref:CRC domain-containing protein TSO1-like n=1 Tax=Durio zibethinus TaxID=66656 RepID=A0A6P5ZFT5_DURZI|nr:CRC domain-containing protein TSO1-like [Durio zibethinus]